MFYCSKLKHTKYNDNPYILPEVDVGFDTTIYKYFWISSITHTSLKMPSSQATVMFYISFHHLP